MDIVEHATEFQVAVELPGMAEQDIEVKVVNDTLAIKGEKKEEKEENKKDYHLSERRYGAFQRTFRLPDDVDGDKIAASFKSGVLTVVLPKRAEAIHAERKIAVKAD